MKEARYRSPSDDTVETGRHSAPGTGSDVTRVYGALVRPKPMAPGDPDTGGAAAAGGDADAENENPEGTDVAGDLDEGNDSDEAWDALFALLTGSRQNLQADDGDARDDNGMLDAVENETLAPEQIDLQAVARDVTPDELGVLQQQLEGASNAGNTPIADALASGAAELDGETVVMPGLDAGNGSAEEIAGAVAGLGPKNTRVNVDGDRYSVEAHLNPWYQVVSGKIRGVSFDDHTGEPGWEFVEDPQSVGLTGTTGDVDRSFPLEAYSFEQRGRRVHTVHNPRATTGHGQSAFHRHLTHPESSSDLSYNDMRRLFDAAVGSGISIEEIRQALEAGVRLFDPNATPIALDRAENIDAQLVAQHLLRYQYHNLGPLKRQSPSSSENQFRALELEKSKRFLTTRLADPGSRDLVLPPQVSSTSGGNRPPLHHAMSGLIDLNRPQPATVFDGEAYKAVFLLARQLFREAMERANITEQDSVPEKIEKQRRKLNPAYFDLLPRMQGSTVPHDGGKDYAREVLKLPWDSDEESFFADDSASEESSGEAPDDERIYSGKDNVDLANQKRQTFTGSLGLFSKMESQKALIDEPTSENQAKFRRIGQRVNRRVNSATRRYGPAFQSVAREAQYRKQKRKLLEKLERHAEKQSKGKKRDKKRKPLDRAKRRIEQRRRRLERFYARAPMDEIERLKEGSKQWKRGHRAFRGLGKKTLEQRLWASSSSESSSDESSSDESSSSESSSSEETKSSSLRKRKRRSSPRRRRQRKRVRMLDVFTPYEVPYAVNDPRIRDGGQCLWDALRVYGFSNDDLAAAAGSLTVDAHVNASDVWPLIRRLNTQTGRHCRLVLDIFSIDGSPSAQHTHGDRDGDEVLHIGMMIDPNRLGHYVPRWNG